MTDTLYVNARLLDAATNLDALGGLMVRDGVIADWGAHIKEGAGEVIDCGGNCLTMGLIDLCAHVGEPGNEHKETIASALTAAAHGGVTSLVASSDTDPPIDHVAMVGFMERKAREAKKSKLYPLATLTRAARGDKLTDMGLLLEAGAIALGDPRNLYDSRTLYEAFLMARGFDALICHNLEEPSFAHGVMNEGVTATRLGVEGIPAWSEALMLERTLRLLRKTKTRCHIHQVTTQEAVTLLEQAKNDHLPITADAAPPHFLLTEKAVGDYHTAARLAPPLRREEDRCAILDGLKNGTIDAIASHHMPQDKESKNMPFSQAAAGYSGLESLLPLSLRLYHEGHCSILHWLKLVTHNPAKIMKLNSGGFAQGAAADLICWNMDKKRTLDPAQFMSKSRTTPFANAKVQGEVIFTLIDGVRVYGI